MGGWWYRGRKAALHVTFIRLAVGVLVYLDNDGDVLQIRVLTSATKQRRGNSPPTPILYPSIPKTKIHLNTLLVNSQEHNNFNGGRNSRQFLRLQFLKFTCSADYYCVPFCTPTALDNDIYPNYDDRFACNETRRPTDRPRP